MQGVLEDMTEAYTTLADLKTSTKGLYIYNPNIYLI